MKIVAIDFETATNRADSACALSLVTIRNGKVVGEKTFLIRPPRQAFRWTRLHGISWEDVKSSPTFAELVPKINRIIRGADYIAAHSAGFDRKIMYTCYGSSGHRPPGIPFICTSKIAKCVWKMPRYALDVVCKRLRIPLVHHDPTSDANACARILLAAMKRSCPVQNGEMGKPSYSVKIRKKEKRKKK
jgi:DNA polymerase-3 subunit epsilon